MSPFLIPCVLKRQLLAHEVQGVGTPLGTLSYVGGSVGEF